MREVEDHHALARPAGALECRTESVRIPLELAEGDSGISPRLISDDAVRHLCGSFDAVTNGDALAQRIVDGRGGVVASGDEEIAKGGEAGLGVLGG